MKAFALRSMLLCAILVVALTTASVVNAAPTSTIRALPMHRIDTAQATVINCFGLGLVSDSEQYGRCHTSAIDGPSYISTDGKTASLGAVASKQGAQATALYWASNGPVPIVVSKICVTVNVTGLQLKGHSAYAKQLLVISYDGAQHTTALAAAKGNNSYCGNVPLFATNVWWQLISLDGASKGADRAEMNETYGGVTFTP